MDERQIAVRPIGTLLLDDLRELEIGQDLGHPPAISFLVELHDEPKALRVEPSVVDDLIVVGDDRLPDVRADLERHERSDAALDAEADQVSDQPKLHQIEVVELAASDPRRSAGVRDCDSTASTLRRTRRAVRAAPSCSGERGHEVS